MGRRRERRKTVDSVPSRARVALPEFHPSMAARIALKRLTAPSLLAQTTQSLLPRSALQRILPAILSSPLHQQCRHSHNIAYDKYRFRYSTADPSISRPLLNSIRSNNQNATWKAYLALDDADKLKLLPTEYHSLTLHTFRLKHITAYSQHEISIVRNRLFYVLRRMKALSCQLDARDYNHLLDFFGRVGDLSTCDRLWSELRNASVRPTVYTFNFYLYATFKSDRPARAFDIFLEMQSANINPTNFTYDTLIRAYGKMNDPAGAAKLFDTVYGNGVATAPKRHSTTRIPPLLPLTPTVATFTALLDAYGRSGKFSSMRHIYTNLMPLHKVSPNLAIYNCLIRWHCEHRDMDGARVWFFEMQQRGVKPNVVTFNYMVKHEALRHRRVGRAQQLMDLMKERFGINPLIGMLRVLVKEQQQRGRFEEAKKLVEKWWKYTGWGSKRARTGNIEEKSV
ncbi:hypothetical protein BC937DRAFT_95422 [Endogone sp. FLAS-F59071]|nr:hypothetical protein BC937DRAFT_95422 [Endogone sp. FLAS-F59071]|eukprot:RUS13376.1 hypothetical protein BC937DRAFT_95422 [Endogone sp. FLAS-F59071]